MFQAFLSAKTNWIRKDILNYEVDAVEFKALQMVYNRQLYVILYLSVSVGFDFYNYMNQYLNGFFML